MITFVVPVKPVGLNESYRRRSMALGGGGLMKTDAARAFAQAIAAAGRLALRGAAAMTGPVAVTLVIFFADERPDIDGPLKALLDSMQEPKGRRPGAGVYRNDRQVRRLLVERDCDGGRPRVEVYVEPFLRRILPLAGLAPAAPDARARELRGILGPKPLERLNRRRLQPSVRRPA